MHESVSLLHILFQTFCSSHVVMPVLRVKQIVWLIWYRLSTLEKLHERDLKHRKSRRIPAAWFLLTHVPPALSVFVFLIVMHVFFLPTWISTSSNDRKREVGVRADWKAGQKSFTFRTLNSQTFSGLSLLFSCWWPAVHSLAFCQFMSSIQLEVLSFLVTFSGLFSCSIFWFLPSHCTRSIYFYFFFYEPALPVCQKSVHTVKTSQSIFILLLHTSLTGALFAWNWQSSSSRSSLFFVAILSFPCVSHLTWFWEKKVHTLYVWWWCVVKQFTYTQMAGKAVGPLRIMMWMYIRYTSTHNVWPDNNRLEKELLLEVERKANGENEKKISFHLHSLVKQTHTPFNPLHSHCLDTSWVQDKKKFNISIKQQLRELKSWMRARVANEKMRNGIENDVKVKGIFFEPELRMCVASYPFLFLNSQMQMTLITRITNRRVHTIARIASVWSEMWWIKKSK